MALVNVTDLSIRYRGPSLLDEVSFQIERGQRIGLLGRNGAGKTTLLRILAGQVDPDGGSVTFAPGTRVALLQQDVPRDTGGPVREVVARALADRQRDDSTAWQSDQRIERILSQMQLDPADDFQSLSSGMKRRVLLAGALVGQPDLLLLDEPTNHLDIESIDWLESFLSRFAGTLVFVTHDRVFLRRLATRILEIDRGQLFDWSCDYDTFLERKEQLLAAEEKQNALFDKKLAEEEVWIRTGIKARRTRNEGRVRALEAMRKQRSERRSKTGDVQLEIQEGQRSGRLVAVADEIGFGYPGRPIVRRFSTTILRGDKVGIIGPNGAGKTTLLRLLLGQLSPEEGTVRLGTNLQIAYFDQLRDQLDDERSVQDNVADGFETVTVGGRPRHVVGYLRDFLFTPERARMPVKFLSGGERNRVLLARLFAKPANVIVLDEPTNDLDAETLEMLEDRLVQFAGTVLMVSHDREFLNNVVTSTIAFEDGQVREYVGGYDDWVRQRQQREELSGGNGAGRKRVAEKPSADTAPAEQSTAIAASASAVSKPRRRSYKEQRELAALPEQIEKTEAEIATLHAAMAEPTFYQQPGNIIAAEQARLKGLDEQLAAAYARWEELEGG